MARYERLTLLLLERFGGVMFEMLLVNMGNDADRGLGDEARKDD